MTPPATLYPPHDCEKCGAAFCWTGREWLLRPKGKKQRLTQPRKLDRQDEPEIRRCPSCHELLPEPIGTVKDDDQP